jgi:hypothetical protein
MDSIRGNLAGYVSLTATVIVSLLIAAVIMVSITVFVSSRVRRAPSVATEAATQAGAFVVCARHWPILLLRWVGVFFIAVGVVLLVLAIVFIGRRSVSDGGIPGVFIALFGLVSCYWPAGCSGHVSK